jgi:CRP/FNR family transcriptional regulator, anaerobic regulatory protein
MQIITELPTLQPTTIPIMDKLRLTISNLTKTNTEQINYILSHFKRTTLKKGEHFIGLGERCDKVAFIRSGIVRFYYFNKHDEETTCYFAFANEFITSIKSFNNKTESREGLECVTDVDLYTISRYDIEMLYSEIPATQKITRKVYEQLSINLQKRIAMLQINSAEERYNFIQDHQSVLLQNVPLQYLASFLGVTPQHLSRLRKSKTTA